MQAGRRHNVLQQAAESLKNLALLSTPSLQSIAQSMCAATGESCTNCETHSNHTHTPCTLQPLLFTEQGQQNAHKRYLPEAGEASDMKTVQILLLKTYMHSLSEVLIHMSLPPSTTGLLRVDFCILAELWVYTHLPKVIHLLHILHNPSLDGSIKYQIIR